MSYRSFKRVLGETHLERKCRLLFGCCLFLLITGGFWWLGRRTENLVKQQNQKAGPHFVDQVMLKNHWTTWNNNPEFEKMLLGTIRDMETQPYDWEVISLTPPPPDEHIIRDKWVKDVTLPRSLEEQQIVKALRDRFERQIIEQPLPPKIPPSNSATAVDETGLLSATDDIKRISAEDWVGEKGEYHYYQPVYWKESCLDCHFERSKSPHPALAKLPPFRVIKVIIPTEETQEAIALNRALLLATAIITVFVSMVAMYLIVRYVVVKPLKHLRDVSDEISRGNIELRADIRTNDEFEELATAFNRMMRSLVDAQNELRDLNVNLDSKVDELAQANMRLYEMNRLRGDFLANMSHELRTPLNSIIGFSDVLQGIDTLTDKQRRYVQNIQHSGRLLLDMINDILDLAKMESGKMEVRFTEFHVEAVVKAQCDLVRSLTEEKNIGLEAHVESGLPLIYQDQSKVQQILTNLLSNAIKFTPEGGLITVTGRRNEKQQLELSVSDTGVGIAEEDRDVIFEKFRQGSPVGTDNLSRSFTGTGLGLSIVKELCKLLGGDITFESDLGKGSEFKVCLPWRGIDRPRRDSSLTHKLDEITKSYRVDVDRSPDQSIDDEMSTTEFSSPLSE